MSRLANLFLSKDKQSAPSEDFETEEPRKTYTILFVDDEQNVLKAMKRIFRSENYTILTAENGTDALKILEDNTVEVIISDHRMPGITGAELLRIIKDKYPRTIRIMLTGYADVTAIMGAVNDGAVYKFITKPWNDDDLRLTVSLALEQFDLIQENIKLKNTQHVQEKKIKQLSKFINVHRSRAGQILTDRNLIRKEDMDKALAIQTRTNQILPVILTEMGCIDDTTIMSAIQEELRINRVFPKEFHVPAALSALIPKDICVKNLLVPLKKSDGRLFVAMADPTDYTKIDDLKFIAGLPIETVIATQKEILEKIHELYGECDDLEAAISEFSSADPTETIEIILEEEEDSANLEELLAAKDQPPAIRIVNAIISDSIRHKASDIHIEPKTKYVMVRYRIDGLLHDKIHIPISMHPAIVSRIKVMAELDIAERRRPQDGRVTIKTASKMVDMRLSTLPTVNGEKIVLRLLDRNAQIKTIAELGLSAQDLERVSGMIHQPQGCVLTTGPTGSGKTSTLYSILQENATITKNYTTIEDPVEYFMGMAEQVMIREKIGLSFPVVLRAILRQDPNVIMLGEIRDFETAEVAFHAALTGHLVLSTLHTNSSVAAITRLKDMGIKPYVISDAISGIIAQRLVRVICPACRVNDDVSPDTLKALQLDDATLDFTPQKGRGCERCNSTGFAGRKGIFEIFRINTEIKAMIHKNVSESELIQAAKWYGMRTLLEDGIDKIRQGITTCDEIIRVLGPQHDGLINCPSCDARLHEKFSFCPFCAYPIASRCRACDSFLEADWHVCPLCGKAVAPHPLPTSGST